MTTDDRTDSKPERWPEFLMYCHEWQAVCPDPYDLDLYRKFQEPVNWLPTGFPGNAGIMFAKTVSRMTWTQYMAPFTTTFNAVQHAGSTVFYEVALSVLFGLRDYYRNDWAFNTGNPILNSVIPYLDPASRYRMFQTCRTISAYSNALLLSSLRSLFSTDWAHLSGDLARQWRPNRYGMTERKPILTPLAVLCIEADVKSAAELVTFLNHAALRNSLGLQYWPPLPDDWRWLHCAPASENRCISESGQPSKRIKLS